MKIQIQGYPAFRVSPIRDPRYLVILFWASFHDFEEKKSKKAQKVDFRIFLNQF